MNFVFDALVTTPSARCSSGGHDPEVGTTRMGSENMISNPQYHVHEPFTVRADTRDEPPSMVARSPGYWRTIIGTPEAPLRLLVKFPRYVPPRSQIVAPGFTAAGCERAVCRSQGLAVVPDPLANPDGET